MKYIYIDVDGVLNPTIIPEHFNRYIIKLAGQEFLVGLSPEHADWLLQLANATESELVWGSTWQQYANREIGQRIALPELEHLDLIPPRWGASLGWTKAAAAEKHAGDSKFVFFDDQYDLGWYLEGKNGLHIMVDHRDGLQLKHIEMARNFLLA